MCINIIFMSYTKKKHDLKQSCSMGMKEGTPVGVGFKQLDIFVEAQCHSA